jgi:MSHA biogenesis protein MshL
MKLKPGLDQNMKLRTIIPCVALSLAACSTAYPPRDTSTLERINDQLKQAALPRGKISEPVLPAAVKSSLLPPPRTTMPRASSKRLEQRFDLVVTDAPIYQVLTGIVNDTPYSIMVKPKGATPSSPVTVPGAAPGVAAVPPSLTGLADKVTVNLKNVTMFEALDAIREVYGYDYTIEGHRIYVQQPELQTQMYQVNYIIGQRRGVSDMQVIGGASPSSTSTGGSGASYTSVQAGALSNFSKADVWGEVEDTLRTTLGCQIPKSVPRQAGGASSGSSSAGGGSSSGTTAAVAAASRADVSFVGDMQPDERQRGVGGCSDGRAMSINQMSGTIMVRGMPNEHRMIGKMLRAMQLNIERQVIIEAKIIDVELNSDSQQGVNWAVFNNNQHRFSMGANTSVIGARATTTAASTSAAGVVTPESITPAGLVTGTLGAFLGGGAVGAKALASGLGVAVQYQNFMAMINFLQTQGSVHVLSSPRIATLNNQKAMLKVGSEEPFVTNASGGQIVAATGVSPATVTNPTITYQPFFSGVSLDVTPQIDDAGNITLHVHSMVNSINVKDKLAIIGTGTGADRTLPFAVNSINETDNVVKTRDGQVVVIGGLMTESSQDNRSKVPGAGDVPGVGALFGNGEQSKVKRELVILLKPTVVKDDSAWTNDITETQGRIEKLSGSTQPLPKSQ